MMFAIPRYAQVLLFLCIGSTIICAIFIIFPNLLSRSIDEKVFTRRTEWQKISVSKAAMTPPKRRNFTDKEVNSMSILGQWLLSPEGSLPPLITASKKEPYLILIWKHGLFLERRHIRRFTNKKFPPLKNCTVKNCVLSYRSEDLYKAKAVVFHLHLTKSVLELPPRIRSDQRWIFLTDESPMHTFLYRNQKLSEYNGLFNWSMSYRMDSDVPVPYGRTISNLVLNTEYPDISVNSIKRLKTKLVAIMGSNCAGYNRRWNYAKELKSLLANNLDIYGKCLNGNVTACPGHFDRDCAALNVYKFYLAFENSNCREYLTEKVFWHGYQKLAVPIIMGAPKKDCERLLPPHSFLHVSDFANPTALVNYINYLDRHDEKYFEYHEWRKYYSVINEHGYFGSISRHYCRICEALHYNSPTNKVYKDIETFWNKKRDCIL